jgi:hypothetical protein
MRWAAPAPTAIMVIVKVTVMDAAAARAISSPDAAA